jgi:5-methyltetrahydrofolate--homocysteine methyltransferase
MPQLPSCSASEFPITDQARVQRLIGKLRDGFLICDGAMGTTLSAGGHEPGRSLELLNVEQPDLVRAAHRAYVEAGAEIIQTNTFQGSRPVLERHPLDEGATGAEIIETNTLQGSRPVLEGHRLANRTRELNAAGARLAREAAGDDVFVAGCIGPTGKILEPYGDYPEEAARAAFAEQAEALAEGGVDMFIIETFTALEEIRAAINGAAATGLPIAASMSFDPSGRTAFGVTPETAAKELTASGALVVGANCGTISSMEMADIIAKFRAATPGLLIAQPNAGRPQRTESGAVYPETPEMMADAAERFRELGVAIIGACCGSTAAHIRAIAARLRGR